MEFIEREDFSERHLKLRDESYGNKALDYYQVSGVAKESIGVVRGSTNMKFMPQCSQLDNSITKLTRKSQRDFEIGLLSTSIGCSKIQLHFQQQPAIKPHNGDDTAELTECESSINCPELANARRNIALHMPKRDSSSPVVRMATENPKRRNIDTIALNKNTSSTRYLNLSRREDNDNPLPEHIDSNIDAEALLKSVAEPFKFGQLREIHDTLRQTQFNLFTTCGAPSRTGSLQSSDCSKIYLPEPTFSKSKFPSYISKRMDSLQSRGPSSINPSN